MEKTTTLPGESSLDGTRTHGHFTTTLEMSAAEVEPAQAPGGVQVSIQEIADNAGENTQELNSAVSLAPYESNSLCDDVLATHADLVPTLCTTFR